MLRSTFRINKMKSATFGTVILSLFLTANIANAQMMGLSFHNITSNGSVNIENQLNAQVRDKSEASLDFGSYLNTNQITINDDEVLFTFTNDVNAGRPSNISEIYFDDGTIFSQVGILNNMGGTTNFSGGMKPKDLPGGGNNSGNQKKIDTSSLTTAFDATAGFGADTGNESDGINASNDILGIIIKLQTGLGFSDLQLALANGDLRLGMHVRSINNNFSDSFINNPFTPTFADVAAVPLPAAAWLFGPALLLAARTARKKSSLAPASAS